MGHKTYSAIIGAVLLEGDKVARAGWDSRLGYPSVDPPHWTLVVPEGLPQDTTIGETNNVRLLVLLWKPKTIFYCPLATPGHSEVKSPHKGG